jgi:hypothetical protein
MNGLLISRTGDAADMADRLRRLLRARADRMLSRQPSPWSDPRHTEAREAVYRFLDELISDLAERIKREPDPLIRRAIVHVLGEEEPFRPRANPLLWRDLS